MKRTEPPYFLDCLLLFLLSPRDRETVSGDLYEEFRDVKLPELGQFGAQLWYMGQVFELCAWKDRDGSSSRACSETSMLLYDFGRRVARHDGYSIAASGLQEPDSDCGDNRVSGCAYSPEVNFAMLGLARLSGYLTIGSMNRLSHCLLVALATLFVAPISNAESVVLPTKDAALSLPHRVRSSTKEWLRTEIRFSLVLRRMRSSTQSGLNMIGNCGPVSFRRGRITSRRSCRSFSFLNP
jgi:hypothetical protein